MSNYFYISKKCRSLVRELSSNPFSYFAWMEQVIGFHACYNLAMVLSLKLSKESGVRLNWNLIRDRLNVIASNFVNTFTLPFFPTNF